MGGKFMIVNEMLVAQLKAKGAWNDSIKNRIIANGGSVMGIAALE